MATAEFAIALPAIVLVLLLALSGISAGISHLAAADAARAGARAVAVGEPAEAAHTIARQVAGEHAAVSSAPSGSFVTVSVEIPLRGPLGAFGLTAHAEAHAVPEPTGGQP